LQPVYYSNAEMIMATMVPRRYFSPKRLSQ
jgi:hypothetical protein